MTAAELAQHLTACGIPLGAAAAWENRFLLPRVRSASRLPECPKSILLCAFPYYTGIPRVRNLSLYAMLPDYHTIVLGMLEQLILSLQEVFPTAHLSAFADASPVDEVAVGASAGLGVLGENGLLLLPRYGSYAFLGEIVTDIVLPYGTASGECLHCGACRKACPGGALTADGFCREKCLSHISQKKGNLTEEEAALLRRGGLVWGCDVCQTVCPLNRSAATTPLAAFCGCAEPVVNAENLDFLLTNRAFAWRGRSVLERNLAILEQKKEHPCDTKF